MSDTKDKTIRYDDKQFSNNIKHIIESLSDFANLFLFERFCILTKAFKEIVSLSGCNKYDFILTITRLEERYGKMLIDTSAEILDSFLFESNSDKIVNGDSNSDVVFAAFYYIALTHCRYEQKNELQKHLKKYYSYFINVYPLTYEIFGRYCTLNNDYRHTLDFVEIAIRELRNLNIENVALNVTYASAICEIAEYCFLHRKIFTNAQSNKDPVETDVSKLVELALENVGTYQYDKSYLEGGKIEIALEKLEKAIEYNPNYPKYPFLKGKLLFFQALYTRNYVTPEECDNSQRLLKTAIKLLNTSNKNYESLRWKYERFDNIIEKCPRNSEKWYEAEGYLFEAAKDNIIRAVNVKEVQPKFYRPDSNAPHVFVSYSSRDFKSVYCDIIEYYRNGILCDYDNEMNFLEYQTEDSTEQKWYSAIEQKIRAADCVLCYLSENYASSAAILLELKFIEKYKKPVIAIDLRGDHTISRLFVRMARDETLSKSITSDAMYWFAKKFEDDNNVIARPKDPLLTTHIQQVKNRLYYLCPETVNMMIGEKAERIGVNTNHPMEDYCVEDKEQNVYVVADGITRHNKAEYEWPENIKESISYTVSKYFCKKFKDTIVNDLLINKTGKNIAKNIQHAFSLVNADIKNIADSYMAAHKINEKFVEKPGCVAIAAVVRNDTLFYGAVGDCMGILVRNNQKIIFSDKQTTFAFNKASKECKRSELIEKFINRPENEFGYGVVNGDESAQSFFKVSHINLEYGDTIYLVSDGVSDYIQYGNPSEYNNLSLNSIMNKAKKLNANIRKNGVCDDMSIIRIKWASDTKTIKKLAQ